MGRPFRLPSNKSTQEDTTKDSTKNRKYKPSTRPRNNAVDRPGDPFSNHVSSSPLETDAPPGSEIKVELDSATGNYIVYEKLGNLDYRPVSEMTRAEYEAWQSAKDQRDYLKAKSKGLDGETPLASNSMIPRIYISPMFDRIFGGNYVDIRPNGSVLLDFGYRYQRVYNPSLPIRLQRSGNFIFDQQINLNAQGKVGEKLKININQDTKAAFDFDNTIKLDYTGYDHEILQKIEAGNVSMPISSTLITGAQNLFGLKTTMHFGKLQVVSVVSNQRGQIERTRVKNGAQTKEIAIRVNDYEDNRHYFVGHFFRNRYDGVLSQAPVVTSGTNTNTPPNSGLGNTGTTGDPNGTGNNPAGGPGTGTGISSGAGQISPSSVNSGIQITRMELYVTNRANNTQTLRNIVAFQDLGEYNPLRKKWVTNTGDTAIKPVANTANTLYATLLRQGSNVFNVNNTANTLNNTLGMVRGEDYELVRGARKLEEGRDFKIQRQLGYLSLNTQIRDDEVLGVAMEYSLNGAVYKIGELQEDYSQRSDSSVIVLKLLRPSQVRLDLPTWNLQMKNIYSLSGSQISKENFSMRIIYRDDSSGVDNPALPKGKNLANRPLVQVFNLDRLDPNNELRADGNFDYIEDVTVDSKNGRIIFPVIEPFGKFLESKFDIRSTTGDGPSEQALSAKYVFKELYTGTKADALQAANKAKFFLVGKAQTTSGGTVQLQAFNLQPGSVRVFAGSQQLVEGTDYTVDLTSGVLTWLNIGVAQSGQDIDIQYEKQDMFAFTQKSFFGSRFDYAFSKDINFGATVLYQNERPIVRRVNIGDEPSKNLMVGFDVNYKSDSRLLTKLVDALPLIQTKEVSTVTASAEYAHLFPGANKFVDKTGKGISFLDDFENARVPAHNLVSAIKWKLAPTPRGLEGNRRTSNGLPNPLTYNDRRASLSWYIVDPIFYNNTSGTMAGRPKNISDEEIANNYVRGVGAQEINRGRDLNQINLNEPVLDLAYFPKDRGQFNYNPILDDNGKLVSPRENWGGIMTSFQSQTDFDYSNIEYIEFWMMDPLMRDSKSSVEYKDNPADGVNFSGREGGKLTFDLGSVSEDVMKDGRQMFENGLPISNDPTQNQFENTSTGRVPTRQILNRAFDNTPGARELQDVGLDGLNDAEEAVFLPYQENFVNRLPANISQTVRDQITTDISNDNFKFYRDESYDGADAGIIERYRKFNNTQNNSPLAGGQNSTQGDQNPDNEDINQDNTLNEVESYYSYKVDFEPSKMQVGQNYIVNQIDVPNGSKWYLFRIPIRELGHPNALRPTGNPVDFKTIKFMRMYLSGFEAPVVCRFYNLQLIASTWRKYPKPLFDYGVAPDNEDDANFIVSTVNIEENATTGSATQQQVPYTLPPGAQQRDRDISSGVNRRLNEQSLSMCINNLRDGDARAVFKNTTFDFLNYKTLQMFVHAQTQDANTKDNDLQVFVRLGTDFTENFYEVSVPLKMTPFQAPNAYTVNSIWQQGNFINCNFKAMTDAKLRRNSLGFSYTQPFIVLDTTAEGLDRQNITVVGNPDLNSVVTVMIGIRNPSSKDGFAKTTCVWLDEFRVTDYVKNDGWAATGRLTAKLADLAMVNASGRIVTPGFGSIEQKISERSRETNSIYNISANVTLDRFLPKKLGLKLPMYVSLEKQRISPLYDPLNPDIKMADVPTTGNYTNYRRLVEDHTTRRSLNFANIQKIKTRDGSRSHPWDVENVSLSFSYSDVRRSNITIYDYTQRLINYGAGYSYNSDAKPLEPFKNVKFLSSPFLKLIKDLNFNPLPNNITVRADINRFFTRQQLRSNNVFEEIPQAPFNYLLTWEKSILFNRQYGVRWAPFRSLTIDYSANANAVVDEPLGDIKGDKAKSDSVLKNVRNLGRLKLFNQTVRVGYKLPLDKLPVTDWLSAEVSYTAGSNWAAAPIAFQDTLGNTIQNSRDRALNGRFDFLKLYNKVKFLSNANSPTPAKKPAAKPPVKPKPKEAKGKDAKGKDGKDAKDPKAKDGKTDPSKPDDKSKGKDKDSSKPREFKLVKGVLRLMMSVRNVSFQYQVTENTVLPGYRLTPDYFGLTQNELAPGIPFVLGSQDADIRYRAAEKGWLGTSRFQNQAFQQSIAETFTANANLEPVRDMRLRLDLRRTASNNYREFFRQNEQGTAFESFNPVRGGAYNISFLSIKTFRLNQNAGNLADRRSKEFIAFENNRSIVAGRLNQLNPNSELNRPVGADTGGYNQYNLNSQDVLIPSFIAAYAGQDASKAKLTAFPKIPLPNWRIDYSGLSKIPWIAARFPSVAITHSYSSIYAVDNFVSSLRYGQDTLGLKKTREILPTAGNSSGEFVPVYQMQQVVISEKFSPLIGINVRTKSKVTIVMNYNRERSMALNVANAQITELRSQDITFGVGFAKSGVKLPIKDKGRVIVLKNELTVRADFTVRDNIQIQRRIGQLNEYTNGGLDIQFKPTANYVVNQRLNLQFYFERTINKPRLSISFVRKVTAFGFQLRFSLQ